MSGFARLDLDPEDFKEELSTIEEKGVQVHIEEVFRDKFNWSPLSDCFWATTFNIPAPHEGLGYNGICELDAGIFLHHFALTKNGIVVAVCEDDDDDDESEIYYRIDSED